jgi:epoxyqueuosine reductase
LESSAVKNLATALGADLCGIAPVDRFGGAPEGFRPGDIFKECKSVLVFAKRLPAGTLLASSCVPYTHANDIVMREIDLLGYNVSVELEELGVGTVIIPTDDPSVYWEADRQYARGILSLRHAGHLAGLGVLGRNTLLKNDSYGNMIQIGAVLLDFELQGDPVAAYGACPPDCRICLESCPQGAIDGVTVDQKLCRIESNFVNERGFRLKRCFLCRKLCPHARGIPQKDRDGLS